MANYKELARTARLSVLEMVHRAGTSHIASNFSCIDIATVLYENLKPEDVVIWSKGWAAASIYYFNATYGRGPKEALSEFPNPPYLGLAETTVPGVLVNGGSVGHGLPIACGIALGKKRAGERGTVYVIASDGEMNEGTTWESAMFAAHHKLDNLVVLVDKNGFQAMGRTEDVIDLNICNAFTGFGWYSQELNGHDFEELEQRMFYNPENMPKAMVCNTIKGKGVSFMENALTFHYKHVDAADYEKAKAELHA